MEKIINKFKTMLKNDGFSAAQAARETIKYLQINNTKKIIISDVAKKLGINIFIVEKIPTPENKTGEIWGLLYYKYKRPRILISKSIPYHNSKRFTVAHNLAHFILDPKNTPNIAYREKFIDNMETTEEKKYNVFAINLLISNLNRYKEKRKQMKQSQIANYYGVPLNSIFLFEKENNINK